MTTASTENEKSGKAKKSRKKWVLLIILIVLLTPIIVAFVVLNSRIATIASAELVEQDLYKITIKQDYFLDDVLEADISDYNELIRFINHKMYFGCSSFLARTPEGKYIAGRNYDYPETGELVFYTNPSDGFASISMTEFGALGFNDLSDTTPDSLFGKSIMLMALYCTMDGVNEKGVMVSILQLTPGAAHPRTEKPDIGLFVAIRLILDRAESVDHAIEMLEKYDIYEGSEYPTQWSAVYQLNDFSMDITIDRHYDKVYHFTADDFR